MLSKTQNDKIPTGWKWVGSIIDSAKLPHLGLLVKWDTTQEKHAKIIFHPETGEIIDIPSEKYS